MDTKKIIKDSYPSSEKIYIPGKLFPIQVGMRENKPHRHSHRRKRKTDTHAQRSRIRIRHQWALYRSRYYGRYRQRASRVCANHGLRREAMWSDKTISPRNTAVPVVTTRLSTLYGSKNTPLPYKAKPGRASSRKCIMPDKGMRHGRNGICRHTGKLAKRTIRH